MEYGGVWYSSICDVIWRCWSADKTIGRNSPWHEIISDCIAFPRPQRHHSYSNVWKWLTLIFCSLKPLFGRRNYVSWLCLLCRAYSCFILDHYKPRECLPSYLNFNGCVLQYEWLNYLSSVDNNSSGSRSISTSCMTQLTLRTSYRWKKKC
jgi:hypothetical protein